MSNLNSVLVKAQADAKFRERLKADPTAVLKEVGVEVPAGITVEVLETHGNELHLFLGASNTSSELNRVLERADKDAAFKQRLVDNPRSALEEATGEKLPAAMNVQVHEPVPNRIRLVLPTARSNEGELSDLELEAVAGGGFFKNVVNALCPNTQHWRIAGVGQNASQVLVGTDWSLGGEVPTT